METQHRKSGWRAILLRAEKMREGEGNMRGTGGEQEGNAATQHGSLGVVQYSSEVKNERTRREWKGNTSTTHGKLGWRAILLREEKRGNRKGTEGERGKTSRKHGWHSILLRAKIGGNEKGTGVEHGSKLEANLGGVQYLLLTSSLIYFFWLNLASWLNLFEKWLKICVFLGVF